MGAYGDEPYGDGLKYRRARQAAWRTIAGETVLLDLERKRMYGLNPAAGRIWQALETTDGAGDLLRLVVGENDPTFGEPEVTAFLAELADLGLVEERSTEVADSEHTPPMTELEPAEELEPPKILWREDVEQIAGTCAFFPSQNPLCDQVPFS